METSECPMEEECEIHEVGDEEEPVRDTNNDSSMEVLWGRAAGNVFYEKLPQAMDMSGSPTEWYSDRRGRCVENLHSKNCVRSIDKYPVYHEKTT